MSEYAENGAINKINYYLFSINLSYVHSSSNLPLIRPLNGHENYLRFPAANEMATMPPSLLRALPPLPVELEYRLVGEHLVLRDVKAAMILDYIPNAVPRR
jgi:hypothetical protein